jgi:hypothetical protein
MEKGRRQCDHSGKLGKKLRHIFILGKKLRGKIEKIQKKEERKKEQNRARVIS